MFVSVCKIYTLGFGIAMRPEFMFSYVLLSCLAEGGAPPEMARVIIG